MTVSAIQNEQIHSDLHKIGVQFRHQNFLEHLSILKYVSGENPAPLIGCPHLGGRLSVMRLAALKNPEFFYSNQL
jgi:hypothetical protein